MLLNMLLQSAPSYSQRRHIKLRKKDDIQTSVSDIAHWLMRTMHIHVCFTCLGACLFIFVHIVSFACKYSMIACPVSETQFQITPLLLNEEERNALPG